MGHFPGFLQALSDAFGGQVGDQKMQMERSRFGLESRAADDAHVNAMLERATNYPFVSSQQSQSPASQPSAPVEPNSFGASWGRAFHQATPSAPQAQAQPAMSDDGLPHGSVNVPGYGTIDPFGKTRMQLLVKRIELGMASDEDIRKAAVTGVIDKNTADAALARRNASKPQLGDANYAGLMGQVAGTEEGAKLPAQTALENTRFGHQRTLQQGQQGFEQGQQGRQHSFEAGQQASRMSGDFANQSQLAYQRQGGGVFSSMVRDKPSTQAPSAFGSPNAAVESQRADWDAAAAALRSQKKSPDAVLGPRP